MTSTRSLLRALPASPHRRRWLRHAAAGLAGLGGLFAFDALADETPGDALAAVRARGKLTVGMYTDLPPFHVDGRGIDVRLAGALADELGVGMNVLPFPAGESMADDLRNMVWKGHYLGYGPADVLLHVPVDRPLMVANPQVKIFAPYYRESVALARDLKAVPRLDALSDLAGKRVAVPGQSLAGWLLIGADGGAYAKDLSTQWKDGAEAARALLRGEYAACAGARSELESVLSQDDRFAIEPLPSPRAPRDGWAVGCAVKADATSLAVALQAAMNKLADDGRLREYFKSEHVAWRGA